MKVRKRAERAEPIGLDLTAIAEQIDDSFVTGHLARLDLATGEFTWVDAGHTSPLLIRGSKVVAEPACDPPSLFYSGGIAEGLRAPPRTGGGDVAPAGRRHR